MKKIDSLGESMVDKNKHPEQEILDKIKDDFTLKYIEGTVNELQYNRLNSKIEERKKNLQINQDSTL